MREEYQSVQVLRGVAAMMVVIYHVLVQPEVAALASSPFLVGGVDLFFVISGFVMVLTNGPETHRNAGKFIARRLERIVPLYWIAMVFTLAIWLVSGSSLPTSDEALKSFLFVPYTSSLNGLVQPFLLVGWTLNLEIVFYLVFAISIWLRPVPQLLVVVALFIFVFGLRFVMRGQSDVLDFYGSPLIFEFAAGMAIGIALPLLRRLKRFHFLVLAVAALVWGIVFGFFAYAPRFVGQGVFAALLVTASIGLEPWFRVRALGIARYLGDASYAIYLFHAVMIVASPFLMPPMPPILYGVVLGTLCLANGLAAHHLIERPIVAAFRSRRRTTPAHAMG